MLRRGLLLAGLAIAGWSTTRVALLLSGSDLAVADGDRHGYVAIFSLVLLPVLVLAVATLVTDAVELWRRGHSPGRSHHVVPGVALVLSAPLAGSLVLAAAAVGVTIVVAALIDRRASSAV
ncbi:MAG: hypothetical protein WBA97_08825 [Actinophytocola sp.]|uniref:hypothetical protein n=1 Tax=Actinophytocola sp. TaxID=1872138 RepID=UPI003C75A3E7